MCVILLIFLQTNLYNKLRMTKISSDIFRMYDIRGVYGEDLTDETAYIIGKGLGTYYQQNNITKVVVGRDNRISGENIKTNFIKGILESGSDVVDMGTTITPFAYFSWHHLSANAAVTITASHNPAKYNGFKCSINKKPMIGENYQKLKEICLSEKFLSGQGNLTNIDIWDPYKKNILSSIKLNKKLKVAIDCGNGTASLFAPELFKSLGCEVVPLFCDSDGAFPNHQPYPQKTEYYTELVNLIKKEKCDVGLSFDGDGDRLGVFDEQGNYLEADRLAMIFIKEISLKNPKSKVAMNVSTSTSLIDYVKECGAEFFFSKTGYPYVTEKMNEIGAIFGGEISGHFFFKDKYFGFDDALYAGTRILEILSQTPQTLSEIVKLLPKYFETREFRAEVPAGKDKFEIIENIKKEILQKYPEAEILDIDGIRFSFPARWGLITYQLQAYLNFIF